MNIGIITDRHHGYARWWKDCYKKMKSHGFCDSDCQLFIRDNSYVWELSESELEKELTLEKQLASDAGVSISQIHGPWRCPPHDKKGAELDERFEKMKISIYAGALLGAKKWIIHPIMPYGLEDEGTDNSKHTFDENAEFMFRLSEVAKQYGITVCLENMPFLSFSLSKPESILKLVKTVGHDNLRICLDTGHVTVFRELSIGEETRRLSSYLRALHVHDNDGTRDAHMMPFYGKTDWKDFSAALKDINFDGTLSLECEPPSRLSAEAAEKTYQALYMSAKGIADQT